jgi:hypothetical protein
MRRPLVVLAASVVLVGSLTDPADAAVPLSTVSGPTPFAVGCNGAENPGTLYRNSEVEPFVSVNPTNRQNLVAVWQQDRWSDGGTQGNLTAVSFDGGTSWSRPTPPPFTRCAGGNSGNGGNFERASDPWVSFAPDGTAYQIALAFNAVNVDSGPADAVLVSKSTDGGRTWGPITTLAQGTPLLINDKEALTADRTDSRFAYAVWDRVELSATDPDAFTAPTYLARTTNGGRTWEQPRKIYDPGAGNDTIGNQIAVLPGGILVNSFTRTIDGQSTVAVIYSDDKGLTWSAPVAVAPLGTVGVSDPRDGHPVRTGDITFDIAVDPRPGTANVYLAWQDARFTSGQRDQIAFARSRDGGKTWSQPQQVSTNSQTQAFTASIEVDQSGNVGLTYYDFTADAGTDEPLLTDHWFALSTDRGSTFGARRRLTASSFDMRLAPDAGGYFVGDYTGLASPLTVSFRSVFATARSAADPTVLVGAVVEPPRPAADNAIADHAATLGPRSVGGPARPHPTLRR